MKLEQLASLVQTGKSKEVVDLVEEFIKQGFNPKEILEQGLLQGMNEIGYKWKSGKAFIPEVLITARALNAGMDVLEKYLVKEDVSKEVVVIGTVKGDKHDIGKNLVMMMLKSKGFEVIDLGTDVNSQAYISAVKEHNAKFVCMSALLTTTMLYFKNVVEDFKAANMRDQVTILCGGAPVTEDFSNRSGCDYYTNDAMECAELIEKLVKEG